MAVHPSAWTTTMSDSTSNSVRHPPSLNQLAARINPNSNGPTPAPRPRLAAFALRTGPGSSSSIATNDSVAVIPASSTRSASPSTSPAPSSNAGSIVDGGEALTSDKLDKLNQETITPPEKKNVKVGYKNIPSLDAITARLAKTRTLSIDGTPKPPEPEMIEDPKTPGVHMKPPEHPLQFTWYV
jgi:translation initiation factor 4E